MAQDLEQVFFGLLSPIPCPVSQEPAGGKESTYVTFEEIDSAPVAFSSNTPRRESHLVQVHIFTKKQDGTARQLQKDIIQRLRAAGIHVYSGRFNDYEKDTQTRHLAMTCEWVEKLEE